ncbi:MAG TPA: MauE/DoxX family redox-associated membrane protein [Actinomycetota bacterium]|nr:MauE/DoxX family redox-associated membrane protein [Actinomycetota bacterium]
MDALALVARFVLCGVFLMSSVTKFADRGATRQAIANFGLPQSITGAGSVLLPLGEFAVAVALLIPATVVLGAIGALVLLGMFIVGIAVNLARGNRPDCNCFGQLHSTPVGWKTLVRNAVLAGLAGTVLWRGDGAAWSDVSSWASDMTSAEQVLSVAVGVLTLVALLQAWFSFNLLKQNGRVLMRIDELESGNASGETGSSAPRQKHGLPIGEPAPEFALPGLHGETQTLASLRAPGKPVLLLFTDPKCGPCDTLMPDISHWQNAHSNQLTIALISKGRAEDNLPKAQEHGITQILLQKNLEVAESYKFVGTPSAVVVGQDGSIATELVGGAEPIKSLVARTIGNHSLPTPTMAQPQPAQSPALDLGADAPDFALPDLEGRTTKLSDLRGGLALVVFWDPQCGFCQRLLPELKALEAEPWDGAPRLVIVSRGPVEQNEAMGFASQVLIDDSFSVATSYGATGTPMGILVDADGKVSSSLAVGGEAVLDLARSRGPIPR